MPCPSGGCRPDIREESDGVIIWGKRATLECSAPHGIHGGDPADNNGGTQSPKYSPQDHVTPLSMVYHSVYRLM